MEHEGLQAELFIGGVYLTLFMKNPQFPLRNPKASLEVEVLDRTGWEALLEPNCYVMHRAADSTSRKAGESVLTSMS